MKTTIEDGGCSRCGSREAIHFYGRFDEPLCHECFAEKAAMFVDYMLDAAKDGEQKTVDKKQ